MNAPTTSPAPYRKAIISSVIQQIIVLGVLGTVICRSGQLRLPKAGHFEDIFGIDYMPFFIICLMASIAFWFGFFIIRRNRSRTPTKGDLIFLHIGFLPLCIITPFVFLGAWFFLALLLILLCVMLVRKLCHLPPIHLS